MTPLVREVLDALVHDASIRLLVAKAGKRATAGGLVVIQLEDGRATTRRQPGGGGKTREQQIKSAFHDPNEQQSVCHAFPAHFFSSAATRPGAPAPIPRISEVGPRRPREPHELCGHTQRKGRPDPEGERHSQYKLTLKTQAGCEARPGHHGNSRQESRVDCIAGRFSP